MKKYLRLFFFKSLLLFLLQSYFLLQAQSSPTLNWQMFSGSMNIFNSLRSFAKPLQYQPALNTISFIQRKSATYSCSPDPGVLGQSGVIVAMISSNWGAQWDSTCIWTDTSHFGRYPQGAISNPPGNQTLSNAYVVSTGPVVNSFQYSGFYSASKVIGPGNYNNSPGTAANAMQYFPTTSTLGTCYYAGNAFSATDNGLVHSLAYLSDPTAFNMHRGAMLLRGTYANNAFNWIADSLPCDAAYYAGGFKCMHPDAMMAWNRAGTVGYVVFMASRYGSQMSNRGWQPVVYKSSNSGASWTLAPSLDFNSTDAIYLKERLAPVEPGNPFAGLVIPQVECAEGWDMVVDKHDGLHIAALLNGARFYHLDSISSRRFYGSEGYSWEHVPGRRPYLADFILDSNGSWSYGIIDSLSSEAPVLGNGPGSNYNPWGGGALNNVVTNQARIQCSRSADGRYVLVSWAESDTLLTAQQTKWNSKPDLKLRLIDSDTYQISPTELNLTVNSNTMVSGRASMHYMSPTSSSASIANGQIHLRVPFTISNETTYAPLLPCQHWFTADSLHFSNALIPFTQTLAATGLSETQDPDLDGLRIYPNPCIDYFDWSVAQSGQNQYQISLFDLNGRLVLEQSAEGQSGRIVLQHLPPGIYLLKLSHTGGIAWKKLVKG